MKSVRLEWLNLVFIFIALVILSCGKDSPDKNKTQETCILFRLDVSPDGRYLAAGNVCGRLWIVNLWQESFPVVYQNDSLFSIASLRFSHDAQYLLVGSTDSTIYAWRVGDWQRLDDSLKLPFQVVNALAQQPFTDNWICGSGHRDAQLLAFFRFEPDSFPVFPISKFISTTDWFEYPLSLNFTPDGKKLVIEGYMGDLLFSPPTGLKRDLVEVIYDKEPHGMRGMGFSPNGRFFAFSPLDDNRIFIYDVGREKIVKQLGLDESSPIAFSADGKFLFGVLKNNILLSWNTRNWHLSDSQEIKELSQIWDIRAIPFSKQLILGEASKLVLWDYHLKQSNGILLLD